MKKPPSVELFDGFGKQFSKPINDPLHDFIECIKGNYAASLTNYMYDSKLCRKTKKTGAQLWNSFVESGNYYIPRIEKELIRTHVQKISKLIPNKPHYIEFGPGTTEAISNKTSPIIEQSDSAVGYLAIDIYKQYVTGAQSHIGQKFPNIAIEGLVHNFYECNNLGDLYQNPVGLFFGNTIANSPEAKTIKPYNTIKNLNAIRKTLGKNGTLIITQDTNRNEQDLLQSYDCEELAMNILYRIAEDPNVIGLNTNQFEYKSEWQPRFNCLKFKAIAKKDQTVILGARTYKIRKDQAISLCRSYKYSADHFQSMGVDAGFKPIDVFFDKTKKIALHIWKT